MQRRGSHKQFSRRSRDEPTRRVLLRSLQLGDASQVLSIMTDKFALNQLRHWISDLPEYRFTEARRQCLVYVRGPVLGNRSDVKDETIHCSNRPLYSVYRWSHIIIQVLPFSERTIMLSTKKTIKVPNVIRIIPERIITQYMTYSQESGFCCWICSKV